MNVHGSDVTPAPPSDTKKASSVTFKGTRNQVVPTESKRQGKALREVIASSGPFQAAFRNRNTGDEPTIIQSSEISAAPVVASAEYGLVSAIMEAYNKHHNLILRPDDIWQAILTQFSFYVNAHAEELRGRLVNFQGKKELIVEMGDGSLFSTNFGTFANRMVDEQITKHLKDESVTKWLLPSFSTTVTADRVAASISIMSTLQAYFEYRCYLHCGIPNVTLEGSLDDWRSLRDKIDRLPEFDVVPSRIMSEWHTLLAAVLDHFVQSVQGAPDLDFWDCVCHRSGGSGPKYLSGWVAVFCCFNAKGGWQGSVSSSSSTLFSKWPRVETGKIPGGALSVPVLVDDNGTKYQTQMVAGQFGYELTENKTTVRPRTDWCIAYVAESPKNNDGGERCQKATLTVGDV
jgi:Domain of unknown function (DUF4419)